MNAITIVQAAIPAADESLANHILWGRTHFPFAPVDAKMLYRAASRFRRAHEHGVELCEFCDKKVGSKKYICDACDTSLQAAAAIA